MIRSALLAALAIASATAATAAPADDQAAPMSVRVSYRDLNLATPSGAAEFERRIDKAVTRVCVPMGIKSGLFSPEETLMRRCRAMSLANARPQMLAAIGHASGLAGVDKPIDIASR